MPVTCCSRQKTCSDTEGFFSSTRSAAVMCCGSGGSGRKGKGRARERRSAGATRGSYCRGDASRVECEGGCRGEGGGTSWATDGFSERPPGPAPRAVPGGGEPPAAPPAPPRPPRRLPETVVAASPSLASGL